MLGQLPRRDAGRGNRIELEVAIGAEMEAQGRGPDRIAEEPGQRFDELCQRAGENGAAVMEEVIGRTEERQVAGGVEHADELLEVAGEARLDRVRTLPRPRPVGIDRLPEEVLRANNEHPPVGIRREPERLIAAEVERLAVELLGGCRPPRPAACVGIGRHRERIDAADHHSADDFVGAPRLPSGLELGDPFGSAGCQPGKSLERRGGPWPERADEPRPFRCRQCLRRAGKEDQLRPWRKIRQPRRLAGGLWTFPGDINGVAVDERGDRDRLRPRACGGLAGVGLTGVGQSAGRVPCGRRGSGALLLPIRGCIGRGGLWRRRGLRGGSEEEHGGDDRGGQESEAPQGRQEPTRARRLWF